MKVLFKICKAESLTPHQLAVREALVEELWKRGVKMKVVSNRDDLMKELRKSRPDLVLIDQHRSEDLEEDLGLACDIRQAGYTHPIIVLATGWSEAPSTYRECAADHWVKWPMIVQETPRIVSWIIGHLYNIPDMY